MRLVVFAAAGVLVLTAGCGSSSDEATAPSLKPSPSPTVEAWGEKMCEYLYGQDPNNGYAVGMAAAIARQSTLPELVALADQAERAGSQNLLRGWCQQHLPDLGVKPVAPQ
ncbi:hypothetical protein BJF79_30725 [Actinomadura sp. CNU-125]|uniref:hypothetical protein n=1 Tax=Actinomadura sp. CNU-125 TaxID=1904961 RepID=UPI00095D1C83|nr:hypothetical protein [Actinomadura sp. CNU-125]OLT36747.1 hypothetical protein BJF79_30725 [Actinomadura sp. CNU-125]